MNDSFTKLCNELESSKAWKGLRGFLAEEVRERKNKFGERKVVLRQSDGTLSLSRQPFGSVSHEGLPVSFPVLPQASWSAPVLGGVPLPQGVSGLPWALVGRPVPWHMQCTLMPCDC